MTLFKKHFKYLAVAAFAATQVPVYSQTQTEQERITRLKSDITFLASDALQGRVTGSPYEKMSADYISSSFEKANLKAGKNGWFQTFQIVKLRIAKQSTELSLWRDTFLIKKLELNVNYYPLSQSCNNDSALAEVLDCGYGLVLRDSSNRDDFAAAGDLKGKVALIRLGFPGDEDNPHAAMAAYADVNTKIREATAHGAAGIIFIPGSKAAEMPKTQLDRNAAPGKIPVFMLTMNNLPPRGLTVKLKSDIAAPTATGHNVIGYAGKFKKRKNTIIICAHHDHLGFNEYGGSRYTGPQAIHNGADDNASGVAAMLELARNVKKYGSKKNNYVFVAFSGEELGLIGSKNFVKNLPFPLQKINYVVNIDMLGRLDSQTKALVIYGTGTSPAWATSLANIKKELDTTKLKITESPSGLGPSDHASFYMEGIPVLHFFTGQHDDYHKPSDDESKINYSGMLSSLSVIEKMLIQNKAKKKIIFTKTKDVQPGRTGFKISLGVMPDYAFTGTGMRLDGVTEGKPAATAGLQRGDIITKVGSREINTIQDYMQALSTLNKGDKIEVGFLRSGDKKTTTIQL